MEGMSALKWVLLLYCTLPVMPSTRPLPMPRSYMAARCPDQRGAPGRVLPARFWRRSVSVWPGCKGPQPWAGVWPPWQNWKNSVNFDSSQPKDPLMNRPSTGVAQSTCTSAP